MKMTRVEEIQKIMLDLRERSGKRYAVAVKKGVGQLVLITKEGKKTVTTPVAGVCGPKVYEMADKLERN